MNSEQSKDLYFVAVKLFLRANDKLLITHDIFNSWDLPGGRIRKNEFDKPIEDVIARKVTEELGDTITYTVASAIPEVIFRNA